MKPCYELEYTGKSYSRCGNGRWISGRRYCPQNGKFNGYFGVCACIELPEENIEQLSLFDDYTVSGLLEE